MAGAEAGLAPRPERYPPAGGGDPFLSTALAGGRGTPSADGICRVRLSVVIPMYNVERYVDACLASVSAQTLDDFEVIIVDDGSTDGSAEIASQWCSRDPRFRLVRQPNSGPGGARNTGIRMAAGTYLGFADSDDIVPPDAYEQMVGMLDESGSDICTGAVRRLYDDGTLRPTKLHEGVHARPARATSVRDHPALLRDTLTMNKIWRRSFWQDQGCTFPEGVVYEDIPLIVPALVNANGIDVVTKVVYLWRYRGSGPLSITQDRGQLHQVRDRAAAVRTVSAFLAESMPKRFKDIYDRRALNADFKMFLRKLDLFSDEYGVEAMRLARAFLATVDPQILATLDVDTRVLYHFAQRDDLESLRSFATFVRGGGLGGVRHVVRNGRVLLDIPQLRSHAIPDEVVDATDVLEMVTRVVGIDGGQNALVVEGSAYIQGLAVASPDAADIRLWLRPEGPSTPASRLTMDVERMADPAVTARAGHLLDNYDWARFRGSLPRKDLAHLVGGKFERLHVEVAVDAGPVSRSGPLRNPGRGRVRSPACVQLADGSALQPRWEDGALVIEVLGPQVQITSAEHYDGMLRLELTAPGDEVDGLLVVRTKRQRSEFPVVWHERFATVALPLDALLGGQFGHGTQEPQAARTVDAALRYRSKKSKPQPIRMDVEPAAPLFRGAGRELVVRRTPTGHATLTYRQAHPRAVAIGWVAPATLEVAVDAAEEGVAWHVRSRKTGEIRSGVVGAGSTVRFDLADPEDPEGQAPMASGWWSAEASTPGGDVPVLVADGAGATLPGQIECNGRFYGLDVEFSALLVQVGPDVSSRPPSTPRG